MLLQFWVRSGTGMFLFFFWWHHLSPAGKVSCSQQSSRILSRELLLPWCFVAVCSYHIVYFTLEERLQWGIESGVSPRVPCPQVCCCLPQDERSPHPQQCKPLDNSWFLPQIRDVQFPASHSSHLCAKPKERQIEKQTLGYVLWNP